MKTKSLREVVMTDSLALTSVISYWKESDKNSVILSFLELQRRNFNIEQNVQKKLNEFSEKQGKSIEELINEYKVENGFENYDDYYQNFKTLLDSEKETSKITEKENLVKEKSKTIFTPVNILLFIGLCVGCYLPVKFLIQDVDDVPKCNDVEVVNSVLEIARKKNTVSLDIENIRVTDINKETKSCSCEAEINFRWQNNGSESELKRKYFYTAQKNTSDEVYVELFEINE